MSPRILLSRALLLLACGPTTSATPLPDTCGEPGAFRVDVSAEGVDASFGEFNGGLLLSAGRRRITDLCGMNEVELEVPAGDDPLLTFVGPETLWARMGKQVGAWDTATGALNWREDDVWDVVVVPGQGFVVANAEAPHDLRLLRPDGTQELLAADMLLTEDPSTAPAGTEYRVQTGGTAFGIIDEAGRLVIQDLANPSRRYEALDVFAFGLSDDGETYAILPDNPRNTQGVTATMYRWDGSSFDLGPVPILGAFGFGRYFALDHDANGPSTVPDFVDLQTGAILTPPPEFGQFSGHGRVDDGRKVGRQDDGTYTIWDPATGEVQPLGGGVDLEDQDDDLPAYGPASMATSVRRNPLLDQEEFPPAYVVPYDGSPAWRLTDEPVAALLQLPDGRVAFVPEREGASSAPLFLAGPSGDDEVIELEAHAHPTARVAELADGSLGFVVADGARSGAYRLVLP